MGNGVSTESQVRFMLFAHPSIIEAFDKFIMEPCANESFAQFIKDGLWLSNITHNNNVTRTIVSDKFKGAVMKDSIPLDCKLTPQTSSSSSSCGRSCRLPTTILEKSISNCVDSNSTSWTINFSSIQSTSSSPGNKTATAAAATATAFNIEEDHDNLYSLSHNFQDSYYVGKSDKITIEELQQFMFLILLPMYFLSKDYQTWLQWKNHHHKKKVDFKRFLTKKQQRLSKSSSMTSSSASIDYIDAEIFSDAAYNKNNQFDAISQNILLSTAAYYDEYRLEECLQQQNTRMFSSMYGVLENSQFGITVCDARVRKCGFPILYSNRAMEAMTGYDLIGSDYDVLVGEDSETYNLKMLSDSFAAMQPISLCITSYRKNGSKFLHMYVTKPVFDSCGHCMYLAGIHCDLASKTFHHRDLKAAEDLLCLVSLLLQNSITYDNNNMMFSSLVGVVGTCTHSSSAKGLVLD